MLEWAEIFRKRPDLAPPGYERAAEAGRARSEVRYQLVGKRRAGTSGKSKPPKFPSLKHGTD
jgi:hypothetical protein